MNTRTEVGNAQEYIPGMESRDLVSVSRPVFSGRGLEGLRSCLGRGLERFRSRPRALSLEILPELFFYEVLQEAAP